MTISYKRPVDYARGCYAEDIDDYIRLALYGTRDKMAEWEARDYETSKVFAYIRETDRRVFSMLTPYQQRHSAAGESAFRDGWSRDALDALHAPGSEEHAATLLGYLAAREEVIMELGKQRRVAG